MSVFELGSPFLPQNKTSQNNPVVKTSNDVNTTTATF